MSFWNSITDTLSKPLSYLYGEGDAIATGKQLDEQANAQRIRYQPGGDLYKAIENQQGTTAAADAAQKVNADYAAAQTDTIIATGDAQVAAAHANDPSGGSVLKDLAILAVIGGAVWAFLNFGGVGFFKSLARKSKWIAAGIIAGAGVLLWLIYNRFKKTASDAGASGSGLLSNLKKIL